jgi:uncharacterized membrane protein
MNPFSSEEERRVSDAITQAERKTSGEIVVVVAARSDTYLYVPPLIGALVSLAVPWPLIFFTKLNVEAIYLVHLAVRYSCRSTSSSCTPIGARLSNSLRKTCTPPRATRAS